MISMPLRIVLLNILVGVLSESYSAGFADRTRLFLAETWFGPGGFEESSGSRDLRAKQVSNSGLQ